MITNLLLSAFNTVAVQENRQGRNSQVRQESRGARKPNPQNEPQIPRAKRRAAHRNRYYVFILESASPVSRMDMVSALKYGHLYLLRFDGKYGVAQGSHRYKESSIRFINSISWMGGRNNPATVKTLGTSGTVRAAVEKWVPQGSQVREDKKKQPR
ncbi:MAG: hypothetical protein PHH26_04600 [Candidatus Thermoplasmatota archaeon]|nr:hypothetical protein [Candidatus Thermoplasmatota archaeon]